MKFILSERLLGAWLLSLTLAALGPAAELNDLHFHRSSPPGTKAISP